MRIAAYNLRFGGKGQVHWGEIIDRYDPDIILAQESYPPSEHLPHLSEGQQAHNAVWAPAVHEGRKMKWGGAAFFKGHQPTPLEIPKFQGWVVGAEGPSPFDRSSPRLRVFSVHAPSGMGSYQKIVNEILDILLECQAGCDVIIGGDFNLTVGERHGSEEKTTTDADLAIQARLRDEFGLINCWQTANPNQPLPQTLRWTSKPTVPYHCDGLFAPVSWRGKLKSCDVISGELWGELSDHNPVIADFC